VVEMKTDGRKNSKKNHQPRNKKEEQGEKPMLQRVDPPWGKMVNGEQGLERELD